MVLIWFPDKIMFLGGQEGGWMDGSKSHFKFCLQQSKSLKIIGLKYRKIPGGAFGITGGIWTPG